MNGPPTREVVGAIPRYRCPCGRRLKEVELRVHGPTSKVDYECSRGHRWRRTATLGFSSTWARLEELRG